MFLRIIIKGWNVRIFYAGRVVEVDGSEVDCVPNSGAMNQDRSYRIGDEIGREALERPQKP